MSKNLNREHAVKQLKKALKLEDVDEVDRQLQASIANALIYIGDMLAKPDEIDIIVDDQREDDD